MGLARTSEIAREIGITTDALRKFFTRYPDAEVLRPDGQWLRDLDGVVEFYWQKRAEADEARREHAAAVKRFKSAGPILEFLFGAWSTEDREHVCQLLAPTLAAMTELDKVVHDSGGPKVRFTPRSFLEKVHFVDLLLQYRSYLVEDAGKIVSSAREMAGTALWELVNPFKEGRFMEGWKWTEPGVYPFSAVPPVH